MKRAHLLTQYRCVLTLVLLIGAISTSISATEQFSRADSNWVSLTLGGDVMLARLVNQVIKQRGPQYIWGNTLPVLKESDLTLVNLECVISTKGAPFTPPRVFYFRADPVAIDVLTYAGIDFVSLANNHAMDYQAPALLDSIQYLNNAGIAHAGAGANLGMASKPVMLDANDVSVGVVAFADHYQDYAATDTMPGTNVIAIMATGTEFARVRETIQAVRRKGAELVVFSIHWGPNMRQTPTADFVRFAHAVIDAGADIFFGHSAHIFQGIEIYKGKVILYDTGDLIDDYYVDSKLRNDQQLLFIIKVNSQSILQVELVPLLIDNMQVNLARGTEYQDISQRIIQLSKSFGTKIRESNGRLVIDVMSHIQSR